ncbi:hypothetical protein C7974DRAFT_411610 [Boeremia exigua]|uniref:uncharacterized protein n=1 Tax=Boeremia exigua TaxID=749465 RepID=UPI001E8D9829|nr:uncharacterized protein C7974DRAFT_411610 [Boeremia exigua]KAH6638167.1 hypothetical protein C7974DRAFT_411610 [Boeremia exigua]
MPPKSAANGDNKAGKTYSADVVAAVLYASGTTSLTMKHYELMSSLDGVKTASAFQHDFRAVIAKAKELKTRTESGEVFEPVQPTTKRAYSHLLHPSRQPQSLLIKRPTLFLDTSFHFALLHLPFSSLPHTPSSQNNEMAKAADSTAGGQKMVSADCVAVLLMAMGRTSISKEQLDMMSALDGTRSSSSFEHQFRSIIAKAKELKKRVEGGETFAPVTGLKRGGTTPATPKKRKGDDADETPTKKQKATPKPRGKKAQSQPITAPTPQTAEDAVDDDLPADMDEFIKSELKWERDYV